MKRFLVLFIVLVLIPLFMGIFCPCGMASPTPELGFKAAPCHGCCPEMSAAPEMPAEFLSNKFINTNSPEIAQTVLKALSAGIGRDTASSRRDYLPAAGEPSAAPDPLDQTQILRI